MAGKSDEAMRTIGEVADSLDLPQHVLRFWESRFPQIKPSRMRGSRRYYRPEDVETLKTIKTLLYSKGYTIKGAKQVVGAKAEVPAAVSAPKQAATKKAVPSARTIDVKSLLSELRSLKSMLVGVL